MMKWIRSRYARQLLVVGMAVLLIGLLSSLAVYADDHSATPSASITATPTMTPPPSTPAASTPASSTTGTPTSTATATATAAPPASSPATSTPSATSAGSPTPSPSLPALGSDLTQNITMLAQEGQQIFRFDTFGDESFWGGTLNLHQAIQGSKFGGVGDGVSPKTALSVGLKVDMDALPDSLVSDLKAGKVDLTDPATTLALLKLNAVVGVTGVFDQGGTKLTSMGIQCALCHSTVDNAFTYGIGHRLDGLANHDLNVGTIISLAPNLQPVADFLGVDVPTVKKVLAAWGPGKFDAELFLDGKGFNPKQVTDGKVTGTNVSGATLIPNALGLGGHSQHTWTGAWGGIPYWNSFVAVLEMHGVGNFFDPRLDDATKFPIAAKHKSGHIQVDADSDKVTSKLPALQFYQLSLLPPTPAAGKDYDAAAAKRGDDLFGGKAKCQTCHNEPIWTEAGWSLHKASQLGIDDFQASRGPDGVLKTANLTAIFVRENGLYMDPANKGRYFHDGRFKTLKDVVIHYNTFLKLGLTAAEMSDLVEYLKSLGPLPAVTISTPSASAAASPSASPSAAPSASPAATPSARPSASPSASPTAAPSASPSPGASPSAFTINTMSKTGIGTYLVDAKGMTLYFTRKDSVGKSVVTGDTLKIWPVFFTPNISVPSSLKMSDFGTITRSDGAKQTTFRGIPLYHFANDKAPGDTNGQGIGGVWFAVTPNNFPPAPSASPSSSP